MAPNGASTTRARLENLAAALRRGRVVATLAVCARLVVEIGDERVELAHGRLALEGGPGAQADGPVFDELLLVAGRLGREADRIRLVHVDGVLASPWPGVADYGPESLGTGSPRA